VDPPTALGIAVRVRPAERDAALDELARVSAALPEPVMAALTGALRWLASEANLGEDAGAWRAYLRERARRAAPEPDLILPRGRPSELAGP
jgi:hypothetical protein